MNGTLTPPPRPPRRPRPAASAPPGAARRPVARRGADRPGPRRDPHREPHEDGPADLRLVPPALATWFAAAVTLNLSVAYALTAAAVSLAAALPLCAMRGRRERGSGAARYGLGAGGSRALLAGSPGSGGVAGGFGAWLPGACGTRAGWGAARGVLAAVLLCACAACAVAGLGLAGLRAGPVPSLAAGHADARVRVTITGDPRVTRTGVRGSTALPASVAAEADVVEVTSRGVTTAVRTPVLLIANPGRATRQWLDLLPSTGLVADAVTEPPLRPADHIAAVLRVHGAPRVIRRPSGVQRVAGRLRAGLREATARLSPDAAALLPGLVVGDTSRMSAELRGAFEATDLLHVFAVSGSNLTIVLALLIGPPALAVRAERRGLAAHLGLSLRLTAVLGGLLTVGFVVLCRPDPSVLRAGACGLITLLAIGTGRRRALLPALAAAVIALILYDPWLSHSYGFALSVVATGALLTLAPRWGAALERHRVPERLAEPLAAAAAAQVCCAPLVVVIAAHVSLVAIPCNLLAEVAIAPATVLGFGVLALAPVSIPAAKWLAWVAGWPAGWVAGVARRGAALPGAASGWPGGWAGGLLLAAVTLAVALSARRMLRHPWVCAGAAVLLLVAVVRPAPLTRLTTGWPPPGWRLAACDVGQGDALVLNSGGGSAVMVDTGPEPASADRCLRSLGVTTIPLLVLTHFHADHVDGLPGVLRGRRVGAIEATTVDAPGGEAAGVRRRAAAAHIPLVRAVAGERRSVGGLDWRVLWPPAAPDGSAEALPDDNPNDSSVVLLVRVAGLTVLLLGDLEPDAQRELLARNPGLPPVDVLKVAHHGSAYQDPGLLRRLRPRLALISCGADNPYGHPSPRTVAALRAEGATVLRTDTDGPIAVTGDSPRQLGAVLAGAPP